MRVKMNVDLQNMGNNKQVLKEMEELIRGFNRNLHELNRLFCKLGPLYLEVTDEARARREGGKKDEP